MMAAPQTWRLLKDCRPFSACSERDRQSFPLYRGKNADGRSPSSTLPSLLPSDFPVPLGSWSKFLSFCHRVPEFRIERHQGWRLLYPRQGLPNQRMENLRPERVFVGNLPSSFSGRGCVHFSSSIPPRAEVSFFRWVAPPRSWTSTPPRRSCFFHRAADWPGSILVLFSRPGNPLLTPSSTFRFTLTSSRHFIVCTFFPCVLEAGRLSLASSFRDEDQGPPCIAFFSFREGPFQPIPGRDSTLLHTDERPRAESPGMTASCCRTAPGLPLFTLQVERPPPMTETRKRRDFSSHPPPPPR